jgi:hypothetical protein
MKQTCLINAKEHENSTLPSICVEGVGERSFPISIFLFGLYLLLPLSVFSENTLDLSGKWRFAIDRENTGIAQKWYAKTLKDQIGLPGSMLENRKGDRVTAQTQWTGSMYDSTYYFSPAMEKYRQPDNIKFPFFLTPDFHYKVQDFFCFKAVRSLF